MAGTAVKAAAARLDATRARITRLGVAYRSSLEQTDGDRRALYGALADGDEDGLQLAEMARLAKLSVSHVQRIVTAEAADRQAGG